MVKKDYCLGNRNVVYTDGKWHDPRDVARPAKCGSSHIHGVHVWIKYDR